MTLELLVLLERCFISVYVVRDRLLDIMATVRYFHAIFLSFMHQQVLREHDNASDCTGLRT